MPTSCRFAAVATNALWGLDLGCLPFLSKRKTHRERKKDLEGEIVQTEPHILWSSCLEKGWYNRWKEIFGCLVLYACIIIGFGHIPLSCGRRDLVELLCIPCGYISLCLWIVRSVSFLSVVSRSILKGFILSTHSFVLEMLQANELLLLLLHKEYFPAWRWLFVCFGVNEANMVLMVMDVSMQQQVFWIEFD